MSLMELFSSGNTGNTGTKNGVTATGHVITGGNTGNTGNTQNNIVKVKNAICHGTNGFAGGSSLTQPQREFLKLHKAEIINELKAVTLPKLAEQRILAYLAHIGETDQALINEFLERCRRDQAVPAWVINWTDQKPKIKETAITCQHCQHFDSFNTHGGGAGLCKVGAFTAGICRWSGTGHQCGSYLESINARI